MKTILKSILLAAAILASPVLAQTESEYKEGFYIQPVVGQFTLDEWCDSGDGIVVSNCEDSQIGFGLQGGYEFNEFWSAEGGFLYVDGFDGTATGLSQGRLATLSVESELGFLSFGGRGKYPIGDNFFVLGKAGFTFWTQTNDSVGATQGVSVSVSEDEDGVDLYYGAGAGLNFGKFGFTVEYTLYNANESLSLISVSGIYKF